MLKIIKEVKEYLKYVFVIRFFTILYTFPNKLSNILSNSSKYLFNHLSYSLKLQYDIKKLKLIFQKIKLGIAKT